MCVNFFDSYPVAVEIMVRIALSKKHKRKIVSMTFTWMSNAFGYSYMMINKKKQSVSFASIQTVAYLLFFYDIFVCW